jgi:tetratricopeptide (TPR) repeat protein
MGRVITLILFAQLFLSSLSALQDPDFKNVDKRTLDLYLGASWKELIHTGEAAIRQGMDYYYMRMRVGIAAYETKDYSRAVRHFRKALEFNSADDTAREYLFFALNFYGRDLEAGRVAEGFSRSLRERHASRISKGVRSFSLNFTGSFLQDTEIIDDYSISADQQVDGIQSITRNFKLWSGDLVHDAGKNLRLRHALQYIAKSYMSYSQESSETSLLPDARLSQFQYYISGQSHLGRGTILTPAIHYVNVRTPYETSVAGRFGRTFVMRQYDYQHDFAASIALEKFAGKFLPGIRTGYSNINDERQIQGSLSIGWFPGGNLNYYSYSEVTRYSVLPLNDMGKWIISQNLGFRPIHWLWTEFWGSWGEKENFAGSGAFLIYNDLGLIREQYGLNFIIPLSKIELSAKYGFTVHYSNFISDSSGPDLLLNPIKFNTHKITGGIKWKF